VHWKAGHYAAIVRREGDRYLVEDPTFDTTVLATRKALEAEASGYFLVPTGDLPANWRRVNAKEGESVWGKGTTGALDADMYASNNHQTGGSCRRPFTDGPGMATVSAHLMLANYQIRDTPMGYTPPVGPPVWFTVRYNYRDYIQPASSTSKILGPKFTHDWDEYLLDTGVTVKYFVGGGGARIFKNFNPTNQTYAPQQYDQTLLRRTSNNTLEMTLPSGSKKFFGPQSRVVTGIGSVLLLAAVVDPAGNAITLTYDQDLRLVALTDAIGQVTTISYEHPTNSFLITKVTDPFGRFATFDYSQYRIGTIGNSSCTSNNVPVTNSIPVDFLVKITDVLGLQSQFEYVATGLACSNDTLVSAYSDTISKLTTPYGTTSFSVAEGTKIDIDNSGSPFRDLTISYPDGSSERVLSQQTSDTGIPSSEPAASIPVGMTTHNQYLYARNTYYWSRTASASSAGDYSKAKIFHWLHKEDLATSAGILSSIKAPLEGRVWFDYAGGGANVVGATSRPTHTGRVLDDGQTQLITDARNDFGRVTNTVDPLGRTFSFLYASNGIDLLEVRQTRGINNELLFRGTYNSQHRILTAVDASGQTNVFTYNSRGQRLTATDSKGRTVTYAYNPDGYLISVDGPLPGSGDSITMGYDSFGRVRTLTGVSGYPVTFDYDALNRVTKLTHPDTTFAQFTYDRLDLVNFRDRAGRQITLQYDNMRQPTTKTDPLGRVTRFGWCRCGQLSSLIDPMGRTTSWTTDVQGRRTSKHYPDGSKVTYQYENTTSRFRFAIDDKEQITQYAWNRDNTLKEVAYSSALVPTPSVSFLYDQDYQRITAMTDGTGTTLYSYNPIAANPTLGAGALASIDGPLADDVITFGYDELGRPVHRAIDGVDSVMSFDAASRLAGVSNALGAFAYAYDGASGRVISKTFPNGQTTERSYGALLQDRELQRITHRRGATPISEFLYDHDSLRDQITTWSQQAGTQNSDTLTFGYDAVDRLVSVAVTNSGAQVNSMSYSYDPAGNRLTEQIGASNYTATYNGMNEIRTTTAPGLARTNEWDALNRLIAVNVGNERTEFSYDGLSRLMSIRKLTNGAEVSFRRFLSSRHTICEERNSAGVVTKRYFPQGMKIETGPNAGIYFYNRDHLGSVRELTDSAGNVRARYSYDPFGRRTKLSGDIDADFGFAGMFFSPETTLSITHHRAYDAETGRWLSRDPLRNAEKILGPNLYAYVHNNPINHVDPEGLCEDTVCATCEQQPCTCRNLGVALENGQAGGAAAGVSATGGSAAVGEVAVLATEGGVATESGVAACDIAATTAEWEVPTVVENVLPEVSGEIALENTLVEAPLFLAEEEASVVVAEETGLMAYSEAELAVEAEGLLGEGTEFEEFYFALMRGYSGARASMGVEGLRESMVFIMRLTRAIFGGG
jgi:RHS repeat-associated protein